MLIDIATAAQLIGRHYRILRGWILIGKLPAVKDGHWMINTDDLLKVEHVTDRQKEVIRAYVVINQEEEK